MLSENKITRADIGPGLAQLLVALFKLISRQHHQTKEGCGADDGDCENEHVMKAIVRVTAVAKEDVLPFMGSILDETNTILARISANPQVPEFNHYVFEMLASLIRHVCKAHPAAVAGFENALMPICTSMLNMSTCAELHTYAYQLIACMLSYRVNFTETHQRAFSQFLDPRISDQPTNIPPLMYLMEQYVTKSPETIVTHAQGVMALFQKLLGSAGTHNDAMVLATMLLANLPSEQFPHIITPIVRLVLARMRTRQHYTFRQLAAVFVAQLTTKYGAAMTVEILNALWTGPDAFYRFVLVEFATIVPFIHRPLQKKAIASGIVAMLRSPVCAAQHVALLSVVAKMYSEDTRHVCFLRRPNSSSNSGSILKKMGASLLTTTSFAGIKMMRTPGSLQEGGGGGGDNNSKTENGDAIDFDCSSPSSQASFVHGRLAFVGMQPYDPNPSIQGDGLVFLATALKEILNGNESMKTQVAADPETRVMLSKILSSA